jgi:hypothetical protein
MCIYSPIEFCAEVFPLGFLFNKGSLNKLEAFVSGRVSQYASFALLNFSTGFVVALRGKNDILKIVRDIQLKCVQGWS